MYVLSLLFMAQKFLKLKERLDEHYDFFFFFCSTKNFLTDSVSIAFFLQYLLYRSHNILGHVEI